MKCRKCGAEISDNTLRCPHCGIKVNMLCHQCKTLNPFGTFICQSCGSELLKKCPSCGAINVSGAESCRKCNYEFNHSSENTSQIEQEQVDIVSSFSSNQSDLKKDFSFGNEETNGEKPSDIKSEQNSETSGLKLEQEVDLIETSPETETDDETVSINADEETEIDNNDAEIDLTDNDTGNNFDVKDEKIFLADEQIESKEVEQEDVSDEQTPEFDSDMPVENLEEFADEDVKNSIEESQNEEESINQDVNEQFENIEIQAKAVKNIINIIKTSITKHVIAVNGPEGCGKTAVLKQCAAKLSDNGYIFLYGSCTPLIQITSFGFIQDAFLRIMGFPPYTVSCEAFIKDFKKSNFLKLFNFLNNEELDAFLNIFYPSKRDKFENIVQNRQYMFEILEKVIKSFSLNRNLVICIDNFELLDGASYDFIVYLMKRGYFNNRLKLLIVYQENKTIQSYFDMTQLDESIFEVIKLDKLTAEDMINTLKRSLYIDLSNIIDKNYFDKIINNSNGNALRLEQEAALLFSSGYINVDDSEIIINEENKPQIFDTFEELIKHRLNALTPIVKNILFMSAILGFRFSQSVLEHVVDMNNEDFISIVDFLKQELFITSVDNFTCEFKSLELWKLIYQEAKSDLLYKENSEKIYVILKQLILSSNLQKVISCTEALTKDEEYEIWQDTAALSAKLGDTNLFIISQKQCLKIMEQQKFDDADSLKLNIYEQLGKLLYIKSPQEAVNYLANVLDFNIKALQINKIIDIAGYFIKSCYLSGNYFGVTEAVDAVITAVTGSDENVSGLDIALIKTRKLKALFNIGNSEQIINIVNEEIINDIEEGLNLAGDDTAYNSMLINAWLTAKIVLAKSYVIQGNSSVFTVIDEIKKFLENYSYNKNYYNVQLDIIEAFANTVKGDIHKSKELLSVALKKFENINSAPELLSEWNLVNIFNRILLNEKDDLKSDLFELAAYTNNNNEHFIKNILKLILGYILKEEGNVKKAVEIYNEEVTYFAKEKVATGALLSWLLIVQTTFESGDYDKALNTALKSLEIAQSAKINNNFFIIYFQMFIAQIYQKKADFNAAKMYFEKAVIVAKNFGLKYQIIQLYIAFAFYLQDVMKSENNYSESAVNNVNEIFNRALIEARELNLTNFTEQISRAKNDFKMISQLNSAQH